ncbi:MAG: hypothetical protein AABY07_06920 [Nanoarchaeota archaeon]
MVKTKIRGGKKYYICAECGFAYLGKPWAQKCEDYCNKYKSCNLAITKYSVKIN